MAKWVVLVGDADKERVDYAEVSFHSDKQRAEEARQNFQRRSKRKYIVANYEEIKEERYAAYKGPA